MTHFPVSQNRPPSDRSLRGALDRIHADAPVVIMLHGLRYDPRRRDRNPHRQIYALNPDPKLKRAASWPRRLGLRGPGRLAIGYGWHACGTLWQAHRQAISAAEDLSSLILRLKRLSPDRPLHVVAHSLGARVALQALVKTPPATLDRVILIAGAVFENELAAALEQPVGQTAEIINVRSKANTLFDLMLRSALPHWGCTAGRGRLRHPRLLDVNIDCTATQVALSKAGFPLGPAPSRICHWSGYLRHDACALYRQLLLNPARTPLPYLQSLVARANLSAPLAQPGLSF